MSGKSWTPIGTSSAPFTGIFTNAGSFKIKNLTVSAEYTDSGLFGYVKNAKITGIGFDTVEIKNSTNCGALTGVAYASQIKDVIVTNAEVQAKKRAGGVIGHVTSNSVIEGCSLTGSKNISCTGSETAYVGGIAGFVENSEVKKATVNITGKIMLGSKASGYAGGVVGYANSKLTDCVLAKGTVTANNSDTNYAGGIVGYTTSDIEKGTVKSSTITGYYAGGIGGCVNVSTKSTIKFSDYKSGYRKSDVSSSSYTTNISQVAVKNGVKIKGNQIGGLFGVITSGVVKNCYTRAALEGNASNATKGGFASAIKSNGCKNAGGTGQIGIVENCYSACSFSGSGSNYSITASLIHNYAAKDTTRAAGYCFNYLFDDDLDGKATYYYSSNLFASDNIKARKSSSDMKKSGTYTGKSFSSTYWTFNSGDYPTLKSER